MDKAARTVLWVLVVAICIGFVSMMIGVPAAGARPGPAPTPTVPAIKVFPTSSPSPSPSPTASPKPSPRDDGEETTKTNRKPREQRRQRPRTATERGGAQRHLGTRDRGRKRAAKKHRRFDIPAFQPRGHFSTARLDGAALRLMALGWAPDEVRRRIYSPFIIGGPAEWSDTWGAPRFGPGKRVRRHEGQDVFCDAGAPVLATSDGVVEFGTDELGGRIARLHVSGGAYWYYAHLSDWNRDEFESGDRVRAGDEIGYCGSTGNAVGTSPHVHFGWYGALGVTAGNPQEALLGWLGEAERTVDRLLSVASKHSVEGKSNRMTRRRFGEDLVPDPAANLTDGALTRAAGEAFLQRLLGLAAPADSSGYL